jgi:hypothetical protein
MKTMCRARLCTPFLVLSSLMMPWSVSDAATFKCVDKDGDMVFRNTPCDDTVEPSVKPVPKEDKGRTPRTEEKTPSPRPYELRLPTKDWSVVLDIPGYVVQTEQTRPDQQGRAMSASNEQTGMLLSIFLERERQAMDARACRERYWRRALQSPVPKTAIRSWETDTMALGQYLIEEVAGTRVRQKHVNAYMGVGDVCIDLHLSKVQYADRDEPLFAAVLESMRVKRVGTSSVGEQGIRRFPIAGSGSLELRVPPSWRSDVDRSPAGLPPTITFHPASGRDFEILITPLPLRNRDLRNPDVLRRRVEDEGRGHLPTAMEDRVVLGEIRGPAAFGYSYSLTDKAPKPGEYEFMTRASVVVGNLVLSATILSHTKDPQSVRDALSMLQGSRQTDAPIADK